MSVPDLLSLFRASMDEDEDVIEENFQTANMIHKLKQTKENKMKRKDAVKKRKRNYKNIEEFETLMNDKNTTETHNKACGGMYVNVNVVMRVRVFSVSAFP